MATTPNRGYRIPNPADAIHPGVRDSLMDIDADVNSLSGGVAAALADPGANGIVVRTSLGVTVARSLTQPAAGFTISNNDGVSGNPTFALANDLAALEALSGTGFAKRTGTDAWSVGALVSGDIPDLSGTYQLLDGDLTAIAALTGTGIPRRTGSDAWILSEDVTIQTLEATSEITTVGLQATDAFVNTLVFNGTTSGQVTIQPAAIAGTWTLTLPDNNGDADQALVTNGAGITRWETVLTGNQTITLTGEVTGSGTTTIPTTITAQNSAFWRGKVSDETGTGLWVFNDSPTLIAPVLGVASGTSLTLSGLLSADSVTGTAEVVSPAHVITGLTSGAITIQSQTGTWTLTLPPDDGTNGQVLQTNGSGVTSWVAHSAGTVTSIATTSPISGGPITTTGTISLDVSVDFDFTAPQTITANSGVTNAFSDLLELVHNSTGTPAANFGGSIQFKLESSTTADQPAGRVGAIWTIATHASRTSAIVLQAVDNAGALAEAARFGILASIISGTLDVGDALTANSMISLGHVSSATFVEAQTIILNGSASGVVTIQPAAAAGTWTLTLPTDDGTNGQVLTTDGAGVTSWTTVSGGGGGTVTNTGTLTSGRLIKGNGGADITVGDLTGDVTTSGGTATTIGALKVTNAMLAGSIAASKLVGTDIATVGTLTAGATGAGFTIALTTSTVTGTLADARLSANVPLLNAANTFTAAQTANSFIPSSSTIPTNGLYLPAANTLGWAINSAAELQLTATALSPAVSGGSTLGTTSLPWGGLNLVEGAALNWDNGDVTLTQTGNTLAFAGASTGYTLDSHLAVGTTTLDIGAGTQRYLIVDGGTGGIGTLSAGGNITGTSNTVGTFSFHNFAIGASDKRIVQFAGLTDGATNSGQFWIQTWNAGTPATQVIVDKIGLMTLSRSLVIGTPTGGDKGAGSINAVTVWRNGTSLDYVFEDNYDLLSIDKMASYFREHKHLPTIPTREVHAEGSTDMGALTDRLWETVECQARYIAELNERIQQLESGVN